MCASPQVLVNCPSRRIISGHYVALDLSHSIHFPGEGEGGREWGREGVGGGPYRLKSTFLILSQTLYSGNHSWLKWFWQN